MENELASLANTEAEKTILGAILLDNAVFFDETEDLMADEFYLESNQRIYMCMNDILSGMVEGARSVDIITLANELGARGWIDMTGGVAYIASLTEGLPRRPVVTEYIRIIKDRARRRRLASIFHTCIARSYDISDPAERVLADTQDRILEEVAGATHRGPVDIGSIAPFVEAEILERRKKPSDGRDALDMTWGIEGLDKHTRGMFGGEMTVLAAESSGGKLMDVEEIIPTPNGFIRNGDLKDGDEIFGEDGRVYSILKAHPIQEEEAFKVSFDDGTWAYVHAGHLWHTWTYRERNKLSKQRLEFREKQRSKKRKDGGGKRPQAVERRVEGNGDYMPPKVLGAVRTTEEIRQTLRGQKGRENANNHSIPLAEALELPYRILPIDPYVLGAWLGDGSSSKGTITIGDKDANQMCWILADHGYPVRKLAEDLSYTFTIKGRYRSPDALSAALRKCGLLDNKHVPEEYMWASAFQRLELLRGLMDTDGCCNADGQVEFTNMNRKLAIAVYRLAASLGVKPAWDEGIARINGKDCGPKYRVKWTSMLPCFHLRRKLARLPKKKPIKSSWRYIVNVEPVGKMKMRCLTTSNPTGLYLFGINCNITHNTAFATQVVLANALEETPCGIFSMEMTKEKIAQRFYPQMSNILTAGMMRDPRLMNLQHVEELKRVTHEFAKLKVKIDDTSPMIISKLRSRVRMMRRKFGTRIFVLDYLQLIKGRGKMNRQDAFEDILFMLRDLPKDEPDIHLLVLSQYSQGEKMVRGKGGAKRTKDALYGGSVIHHATQNLLMLNIENPDDRDPADLLDVEININKQRDGKRGKVKCQFDRDHLKLCYAQRQL